MVLVDATRQVESLRAAAWAEKYAIQSMLPPSYMRSLLFDGARTDDQPDNVILVYKPKVKSSTASLPIAFESEDSIDDLDVTGTPLESPFADDSLLEDTMVVERRQHQWSKTELSQLPLPICDAWSLLSHFSEMPISAEDEEDEPLLDVWVLTDGGVKHNMDSTLRDATEKRDSLNPSIVTSCTKRSARGKKRDPGVCILLGIHPSDSKWWTRTVIKAQDSCSIEAPGMNPELMKQAHLEVSTLPECLVTAQVLCRYNVKGQYIPYEPQTDFSQLGSTSSVSLELKWRSLSVSVPQLEADTTLLAQVVIGMESSEAHPLWLELRLLQDLLEVLLSCWRDKVAPQELPHAQPLTSLDSVGSSQGESLQSRLQMLFKGGGMALQAQRAEAQKSRAPSFLDRQSVAPGFPGRQSVAPGKMGRKSVAAGFLSRMSVAPRAYNSEGEKESYVSRSLAETLELAVACMRENTDTTDQLWSLLSECKTYEELTQMWHLVFQEVSKGHWRPHMRSKNSTRAAKIIQGLISGQMENGPELCQLEGSGVLQPLELLLELGLEKLTADYFYVLLDASLVGKMMLRAPQMPRSGLGVSRDMWLSRCGQLLGWLAQVHTALEVLLCLQTTIPTETLVTIAPLVLDYFQNKQSPVRSVSGLTSHSGCIHEFRCKVNTRDVQTLLTDKFDWWRLTLTSETELRRVRSVFLRSSSRPIFPSQLYEGSGVLQLPGDTKNIQYFCAEATTISDLSA